jgi:hypothetical protein
VKPLTRRLLPPDPHSLCPLSSAEFVEPPPKKIPGYATAENIIISDIHKSVRKFALKSKSLKATGGYNTVNH